jgi:anti-anti-sigma factor
LAHGWGADVDRGPDWLLVRLHAPKRELGEGARLADDLWSLLQGHMVHRMVLELDDIDRLQSTVLGQLVHLHDRVSRDGGVLRLCGLSPASRQVLRACRLESRFPAYNDRRAAIMAPRSLCGTVNESSN